MRRRRQPSRRAKKKTNYNYRRPYKRRKVVGSIPGYQVNDGVTSSSLTRQNTTMPKSMNIKLKYADYSGLTSGADLINIRTNSIFDPEFSIGGGQPLGFDQWTQFYKRYRVNACKVKATFINKADIAGGADQPMHISLWPNYDGAVSGIPTEKVMQLPNASYDFLQVSTGGSDSIKTIEFYTKLNDYFGVTSQAYKAEDNYSADILSNPSVAALVAIQASPLATANSSNYAIFIQVTYYITFYEQKILPVS